MSFIWRRTSVATAAIALVASWCFTGPVEQGHGQASTAAETQVVCITDWTNALGAHRTRPGRCDFHQAGVFPIAHYNLMVMRNLRWQFWGSQRAVGKGKTGISTYGWAPTKVSLRAPRTVCGHTVFTRARFVHWAKVDGKRHKFSFSMRLDDCLG
jgi:hypothetical protein